MSKRVFCLGLMVAKRWSIYSASLLALAGVAAAPAHATLLDFELSRSRSASFELQSDPTPANFSASVFGSQVQFLDVAGTYGGVAGTATISFGTGPIIADLDISGTTLGFTQFAGPDLFTGPADAPIFSPGTFDLTSIVSGSSTLTVLLAQDNAAGSAVPEPATWIMLLTGFSLVGFGWRRKSAGPNAAAV